MCVCVFLGRVLSCMRLMRPSHTAPRAPRDSRNATLERCVCVCVRVSLCEYQGIKLHACTAQNVAQRVRLVKMGG